MTKKEPFLMECHGHQRIDNYFWMRDKDDPAVKSWLLDQNKRTRETMAHTEQLVQTIFEEIKDRIADEDTTYPYPLLDYQYYTRFESEKEYGIYCRTKDDTETSEEVMLDANKEAEGQPFFQVRGLKVSPDQKLMAYATDTRGDRKYTMYFKNLETGEMLPDSLTGTSGTLAWAKDNHTVFYSAQNPVTLRSYRIYKHILGTPQKDDELIYEEEDETFGVSVSKSKSRDFIFIACSQTLTTEYHILEADKPENPFRLFLPRERGHEYHLDHDGELFYILTNHDAKNFRICRTVDSGLTPEEWEEIVPHREDTYLVNFEVFTDYLATEESQDGLPRIQIIPKGDDEPHYLDFGEESYCAYLGVNHVLDTPYLRFGYTSMTTPVSLYHYDMETREKTLLKRQVVLGGYTPEDYQTRRIFATAPDGTRVPISLAYRKDMYEQGKNPIMIYGYGAYGVPSEPSFTMSRASLLDRGFVYAIAHVRGGDEMGRAWYEQGRMLHKKNSFTDFLACADTLAESVGDPKRIYAMGGSAGGLLVGASMNMRPDRFHGVVAMVPFVDVITTMLDSELPLTTGEYDEWGHPEEEPYYHYMLSYSPYDNVAEIDYPHILVTAGFHDTQVHYWEPAKWVAKMLEKRTNQNRLLLKTDMELGHGGASGRFGQYEEMAFIYAFLTDLAGQNISKRDADE